jgi:hypothetical protein
MRTELNSESIEQLLEMANAYFLGWPYTRRLDTDLVNSWDIAYGYADCCFLLAQAHNKPVAFLHGELRQDLAIVHLLAVADGERQAAVDLLAEFESIAKERAIGRMVGPHGPTISYYGGYVLGFNPYHPHWAMVATDAYLLAGCEVTGAGCILTLFLEARDQILNCRRAMRCGLNRSRKNGRPPPTSFQWCTMVESLDSALLRIAVSCRL